MARFKLPKINLPRLTEEEMEEMRLCESCKNYKILEVGGKVTGFCKDCGRAINAPLDKVIVPPILEF